jgi:hypothetical protein
MTFEGGQGGKLGSEVALNYLQSPSGSKLPQLCKSNWEHPERKRKESVEWAKLAVSCLLVHLAQEEWQGARVPLPERGADGCPMQPRAWRKEATPRGAEVWSSLPTGPTTKRLPEFSLTLEWFLSFLPSYQCLLRGPT